MSNYNTQWYQGMLAPNYVPPLYPPTYPPHLQPKYAPNQSISNEYSKGYLQGYPQGYPHGYPMGYQYPYGPGLEGYQGQLPPGVLAHPMLSPRYLYGDQKQLPKIKYDPKKFGHYQNSYFDQLKPPKVVEIEQIPIPVPVPIDTTYTKPIKNAPLKKSVKTSNENFSFNFKKDSKANDSKFNTLMKKQDIANGKPQKLIQNNNDSKSLRIDFDPVSRESSEIKTVRSNISSSNGNNLEENFPHVEYIQTFEKPQKTPDMLNLEKQMQINRNLISRNRKQIDGFKENIHVNHNTILRHNKITKDKNNQQNSNSLRSNSPIDSVKKAEIRRALKPINDAQKKKTDDYNSQSLNIPNDTVRKISPPRKFFNKPPADDFIRTNDYMDILHKGKGSLEPFNKKQERMNKKSEYAKQVKERNKELIKTKPKSLNTSKAESLINSTTNSMTNLTEQVAIIDQKYGKDQKASWKPPGAPKLKDNIIV